MPHGRSSRSFHQSSHTVVSPQLMTAISWVCQLPETRIRSVTFSHIEIVLCRLGYAMVVEGEQETTNLRGHDFVPLGLGI